MHKKYTGSKLGPTLSEKRELREVMRKRGKVPLYLYFHPKFWNCENVSWLNEFLL